MTVFNNLLIIFTLSDHCDLHGTLTLMDDIANSEVWENMIHCGCETAPTTPTTMSIGTSTLDDQELTNSMNSHS